MLGLDVKITGILDCSVKLVRLRDLENVLWRNGSVLLFKVAMILLHVFW